MYFEARHRGMHSLPPTPMGAEGVPWIGLAPFVAEPHLIQNLGDGTLSHSGTLAIRASVAAGVDVTFKVLYNSAVAMTGGQDVTGLMDVPAMTRALAVEGVARIVVCAEDPRHYGRDAQWALCSRAQGNCRTGARTQDSDRQTLKTRLRFQPVDRLHQPVALHFDIEVRSAGKTLKLMLAPRQEIDQKRGDAVLIQDVRQLLITRVRPIAPAVMCEHHRANRVRRHGNDAGQDPARDAHDHVERAGLDRPRRRL